MFGKRKDDPISVGEEEFFGRAVKIVREAIVLNQTISSDPNIISGTVGIRNLRKLYESDPIEAEQVSVIAKGMAQRANEIVKKIDAGRASAEEINYYKLISGR